MLLKWKRPGPLLVCMLLCLLTSGMAHMAHAATFTFGGPLPGDNNPGDTSSWFNAKNWRPEGVPGASDVAVISGFTVSLNGNSATVAALNLSGNLSAGTLTVTSNIDWSSGTIATNITMPAGSVANITGAADKALNGITVNNAGTVNWSGTGRINGGNSAVFNNQSGGAFNATTDGQVFIWTFGGQPQFNNLTGATFSKSGGTGTTDLDSWIINSSGAFNPTAGVLAFNATTNLNNGTTFTGGGISRVVGGSVGITGTVTAASGGTFEINGGTVTGNTTVPAILTQSGSGNLRWLGGTLSGTIQIPSASRFDIVGTADKAFNGATFNNAGTVNWSGTGRINGGNRAIFNNQSGGVFNTTAEGQVFMWTFGGQPTFNNLPGGNLNKTGSGTTSLDSWRFELQGNINPTAGSIALNAIVEIKDGAVFAGAGRSRIIGGDTRLSGTIRVNSPGALEIAGGNTTGNAANLVTGSTGFFNWTGGNILGTLTLPPGSRLDVTGTADKAFNGATFNNVGTVNWSSTGRINGGNSAVFNNQSGGVFNATTDGQVFMYTFGGQPTFNNLTGATFSKSGGTGTSALDSWVFNSTGTMNTRAGVMALNSTLKLNNGAAFSGAGISRIVGGNTTISGTIMANNGAVVELSGGNITGDSRSPGRFNRSGNGVVRWTGGTLLGSLGVAAGGQFDVVGTADKALNGAKFENDGIVNWFGTGRINGGNSAVFHNRASGSFNLRADGQVFIWTFGGQPQFNNLPGADFNKVNGTGTADARDWPFNNGGNVSINSGTLNFGAFIQTAGNTSLNGGGLSASRPLEIRGGRLYGVGAVSANVVNGGTILPGAVVGGAAGVLRINGNYTQTPSGILAIGIGGTSPGTQFDQLLVSGSATLNGTLNVSATGSFRPNAKDRLTFMRYASRTGNFTRLTGLGSALRVAYTSTSANLGVSNEVTVFALSGRVTTSSGVGVAGVEITRSDSSIPVLTDARGNYSFTTVLPGTHTITPVLEGFTFSPTSRSVTIRNASVSNVNFTATRTTATRTTSTQAAAAPSAQSKTERKVSSGGLSGAIADVATGSITLRFVVALDAESASDPAHYTVAVNGRVVNVESASYSMTTRTVTLSLPEGTLHSGDVTTVQWRDLRDSGDATLNGTSARVRAR